MDEKNPMDEIRKNSDISENLPLQQEKEEDSPLKAEMLDHLAKSKAFFKSEQKNDPELSFDEKRNVASSLLMKNPSQFLSRFGHFLKKEHLDYFTKLSENNYELSFHINRLCRNFQLTSKGKTKMEIDVKNRRFEALKSLVDKGQYFSETEMMKRNPLLYEHLIGRYLTEDEKKARDNIDTENITFVNLLMESIDRNIVRNFKQDQQDAENDVEEECDSDEESEEEDEEEDDEDKCKKGTKTEDKKWGEMSHPKDIYEAEENERQRDLFWYHIPQKEQQMLRQEFITNMYQSFLDGRDIDFDYSTVDENEAYDNVELRTQDEEEKYFDSESPEIIANEKAMDEDESEDELDAYMKTLEGSSTNQVDLETDLKTK